jgi:hypothetical protein
MAATYEPIATTTLGSAQNSVSFTSISGLYTDLVIISNGSSDNASYGLRIQFNSDTGSNYSSTRLLGNGSAASSARESNVSGIVVNGNGFGGANNLNTNSIIQIQNYSNSTTYKTLLLRENNAAAATTALVGLWRSTSAITSIIIYNESGGANIVSGSTFTLYGIKAA